MRRQRAVYPDFDFSGVFDQACGDREIIRFPSLPLILESPVRPAAFDADGKGSTLDSELESVRIAPAVAERVNVNGLARHQFALQRFAVTDEAAGSRVMVFDSSGDGRGGVSEVWPRFAERAEVVVRAEAFVRPGGDQIKYVIVAPEREFRAERRSPRVAQFIKLDPGEQRLMTQRGFINRVDRFQLVLRIERILDGFKLRRDRGSE